jgi:hypothetical protein
VEIRVSVIRNNHSDQDGGGIYASDSLILVNSTVSGNTANGNGGGVAIYDGGATAELDSVTVANNTADLDADNSGDGGGIYRDDAAGMFTVLNSIVANNIDSSPISLAKERDCMGDFVGSESLVRVYDNAHCTGFSSADNLTGVDPQLLPLADNGGPTLTHALEASSPAIGQTPGAECQDYDQRGVERDTAGSCDIGAYEAGTCSPPAAPALIIAGDGNHIRLGWDEYDENREVEIWRGSDPAVYSTFSQIWVNLGVDTTYIDYDAIGDLLTNNFYAVRGQNACGDFSAFSNLVGEVDFRLNEEEQTTSLDASAGLLRYLHFALISLPLEGADLPTSADQVADYADPGGSVKAVARWNPLTHTWVVRRVGNPFGTPDFPVAPGDVLLLGMIAGSPDSFAWVGEVPAAGSIQNILVPGRVNFVLLPLDQGGQFTLTADGLAADIGDVSYVGAWSALQQQWYIRAVGVSGLNFPVRPGYPYGVVTGQSTPYLWP